MTGLGLRLFALLLIVLLPSCGEQEPEIPVEDRILGTWRSEGKDGRHIIEFRWGGYWSSRLQPERSSPGTERMCQEAEGLWKFTEDGTFAVGSRPNGKGRIIYNFFTIEEIDLGNLHLRTAIEDGSEELLLKYSRIGEIPEKLKTYSLYDDL